MAVRKANFEITYSKKQSIEIFIIWIYCIGYFQIILYFFNQFKKNLKKKVMIAWVGLIIPVTASCTKDCTGKCSVYSVDVFGMQLT